MASEGTFSNVREHGILVDKKRQRVKCKYCDKEMSGFSRLKYHLGHVGTDVVSCSSVSEDVKNLFKNLLLETKTTSRSREVEELFHLDLPSKRKLSPKSSVSWNDDHGVYQTAIAQGKEQSEMDFLPRKVIPEHLLPSSSSNTEGKDIAMDRKFHGSSTEIHKNIAKFFYENGIDFSVANSPSFKRMIVAVHGNNQLEIPTSQELKGILDDELKVVQKYVKESRDSWASTGCSVLLDGWVNERGQRLVNFVVECPKGPIYLRSADVSEIFDDVDALHLLFEEVIEEVGTNNVVQMVASSTIGWMGAVGKQFFDKHRTIFWSLSASHCIDLMLEKIGKMDSIKSLLDKAKVITRFIYGHSRVLKFMRSFISDNDLVKCSSLKSVATFLTLETMVLEKKNLMTMVLSPEWGTSWEGERVAKLVSDISFWIEADMALKGTTPLLGVLDLIHKDNEPQMGFIYERMDQVKETIKEEFKNKRSHYEPVWKMIDEIWDGYLHSPLHVAGYYLNPSLFYSTHFYNDSEVSFGLLSCIVRLVQDQHTQDKISSQLNDYRNARGSFKEGSAIHQRTNVSPAKWWSTYGNEYPELQNFAIRILSQSCDGISKYGLERDFAEKLVTHDTISKQQSWMELTTLRYNLSLRNRHIGLMHENLPDQIDSLNDWIIDPRTMEVG